jgi:hypothetical protein
MAFPLFLVLFDSEVSYLRWGLPPWLQRNAKLLDADFWALMGHFPEADSVLSRLFQSSLVPVSACLWSARLEGNFQADYWG